MFYHHNVFCFFRHSNLNALPHLLLYVSGILIYRCTKICRKREITHYLSLAPTGNSQGKCYSVGRIGWLGLFRLGVIRALFFWGEQPLALHCISFHIPANKTYILFSETVPFEVLAVRGGTKHHGVIFLLVFLFIPRGAVRLTIPGFSVIPHCV